MRRWRTSASAASTHVIVHGAFYRPGDYQTLVARLASRPELVLEGVTRWEARETRLYRVVK